jgi:hypothetical protein
LERNAELGISFHILEQNLLAAAVIELRRSAVGVAGDALSGFKGAIIFQKIRDAGRPKRVRRIVSRQPRLLEPSFDLSMSAASVRTSGRRDNFPVLPKAAGNKREPGSLPRPVALRYSSRSSSIASTPFSVSQENSIQTRKEIWPGLAR